MKKLVAFIACAFVACSASFADKKADIAKLMEMSGSNDMVNQIVDAMVPQYKKMIPNVPSEWWDKAAEKMKASGPDLIAELTPIYDKYYTDDEIKELIKFYESPIGKKMVKNQPLILQDSMAAGQKWGMKVGQELAKDLQKEGYLK